MHRYIITFFIILIFTLLGIYIGLLVEAKQKNKPEPSSSDQDDRSDTESQEQVNNLTISSAEQVCLNQESEFEDSSDIRDKMKKQNSNYCFLKK